jgi:hypothetical protein
LEKDKQGLQEQEQMLKSVIAAKENKITSDREAHLALEDQILRLESDVRSRDDNIRVMTAKHGNFRLFHVIHSSFYHSHVLYR